MNAVWCVPGMEHWGRLLSGVLRWPLYVGTSTGTKDTVLVVGLYDPPHYAATLHMTARAKRRIFYFCGSDVLQVFPPSLPPGEFLSLTPAMHDELFAAGVESKVVSFPAPLHAPVEPWPEVPAISFYMGNDPRKYGVGIMEAVDAAFPDVDIYPYTYGQFSQEDLLGLMARVTVHVRLAPHDGQAISCLEYMEAGRRVVSTTDALFARHVSRNDPEGIIAAVRECLDAKGPDWEAAAYYAAFNAPERFLADFKEATGCE